MKKLLSVFIIFLLTFGIDVSAAVPGDIIGNVYPSDIKTYFFGHEIFSCNIGGKTAVICEDLRWYYGFYVEWLPDERRLEITDERKQTDFIPDIENQKQRDIAQNIANRPSDYFSSNEATHIYSTDIVTIINGNEIAAFNLNGRTAIVVEDLRNYGYDVIWDENERSLNVYEIFKNTPVTLDIGCGYTNGQISKYTDEVARNTQYTYIIKNPLGEQSVNCFDGEYFYDSMFPVKETFDFLNITYKFENNVLHIDTTKAVKFTEIDYMERKITHNDLRSSTIEYLYIEKVICNGVETQITYNAIVGHFDMMRNERRTAQAYICNGVAYVPFDFICDILNIPH